MRRSVSMTNSNSERIAFHCCVVVGAALVEAIRDCVWDLVRQLSRKAMLLEQPGAIRHRDRGRGPSSGKTCICLPARLGVSPKPTSLHPSTESEAHRTIRNMKTDFQKSKFELSFSVLTESEFGVTCVLGVR